MASGHMNRANRPNTWLLRPPLHAEPSTHVQVFSRRQRQSHHALRRPAAEKRQGTKSREVGHWLAASPIGILISADLVCGREADTPSVSVGIGGEAASRIAERFHNFRVSA